MREALGCSEDDDENIEEVFVLGWSFLSKSIKSPSLTTPYIIVIKQKIDSILYSKILYCTDATTKKKKKKD